MKFFLSLFMGVANTFAVLSSPAIAAPWVEIVTADRLTGEKIRGYTILGKGQIRQFGRNVTAQLVLRCINAYADRSAHRDADEYSAVIRFSENVGLVDAIFRYRFDANPVHSITATLSDRGDVLFASWPKSVDGTFISELKNSEKLRAEISLPWAGQILLEFTTAAADKAMSAIPCGENQPK